MASPIPLRVCHLYCVQSSLYQLIVDVGYWIIILHIGKKCSIHSRPWPSVLL